ncbi:multicopper oxidase family protein [Methylocella tundrae]|nr:multicopper oxidase family protein [Methylocella tundrae]WPP05832.1 multicopper oxidase family protein [Methylocella tundrae]
MQFRLNAFCSRGTTDMFSRRAFLGGSLATCATSFARGQTSEPQPTILRLERRDIEVNGKAASILDIRQPGGMLGVETEVGKAFRVRVENHLSEPSLIHWHGLKPPWRQDGVPGISSPPIAPGESADYDFPLTFDGTFFMHSHQGLQEQLLMSAPLIIRDPQAPKQQEIIIELADFSFTPPEEIYAGLRKPAMGVMSGMSMGAGMADKPDMKMGGDAKPDLNDVKYDAFLANRRTLADPEVTKVEAGGMALLRIINGSAMSAYHIDLGQIEGDLVAVDGHAVAPIRARRFPIAPAQRLDIGLIFPKGPGAYPILAILEGDRSQTGVILVAGDAEVRRAPELADQASAPLDFDLESRLRAEDPLAAQQADRVHRLELTGAMSGYQWSINGVAYTKDTPPLPVFAGERVELVFVNRTMMSHPMHLHGHFFQVVDINGERFAGAMRDTVLVPPKTTVTVAFDADNPGWWALHCHLLYHMEAGMFTTIRYV